MPGLKITVTYRASRSAEPVMPSFSFCCVDFMEFGVAFSSASVRGAVSLWVHTYSFIMEVRREESCTYGCGGLCGMRPTFLLILLLDLFEFGRK